MTDRPRACPGPSARSAAAARRDRYPLLGALPITVMTVATFLVVFAVMMARLTTGADPVLRASASPVALGAGPGAPAVRTRASGGAPAAVAAGEGPSVPRAGAPSPAVITRTSGLAGASGATDD